MRPRLPPRSRLAPATALCLALFGFVPPAAAVDWNKAQPITVIAENYDFNPNKLTFKSGVAYRLRVENHGSELHEFAAPDFFRASRIRNPKALNADHTEIDVPPGQAKDLYFVAKRPGSFKLRCPDHDWAGMVGEITVTQ